MHRERQLLHQASTEAETTDRQTRRGIVQVIVTPDNLQNKQRDKLTRDKLCRQHRDVYQHHSPLATDHQQTSSSLSQLD